MTLSFIFDGEEKRHRYTLDTSVIWHGFKKNKPNKKERRLSSRSTRRQLYGRPIRASHSTSVRCESAFGIAESLALSSHTGRSANAPRYHGAPGKLVPRTFGYKLSQCSKQKIYYFKELSIYYYYSWVTCIHIQIYTRSHLYK